MNAETEQVEQDTEHLRAIYEPAANETPGRDVLGEALLQVARPRTTRNMTILAMAASLAIIFGILAWPTSEPVEPAVNGDTQDNAFFAWTDPSTGSDPARLKMKGIRKRIHSLRNDVQPIPDQSRHSTNQEL